MKQGKKRWIGLLVLGLLFGVFLLKQQSIIKAEENSTIIPSELALRATNDSILNYPGIIKITPNSVTADNPIPGEYATLFRLSNRVSYETSGGISYSNYQRYNVSGFDSNGNNYVLAKNLTYYQGKSIDMKISVAQLTGPSNGYIRVYKTLYNGTADEFLEIDTKMLGTKAVIKYEFFESGTTNKVNLSGMWNIKRLNRRKSVEINTDSAFLKSIYTYTNSELLYTTTSDSTASFVGVANGETEKQEFTYLFQSSGEVTHTIEQVLTDTGYLKYETSAITKVMMPPPQILGDTNEDGTKISYKVIQDIPIQANTSWYPKEYTMYLNAEEIFDLSSGTIAVTDLGGTNVTAKFTITKDLVNNRFKITIPATTLNSPSFVDNSYTFSVTGTVKAGVDKERYSQADGYLHIPMEAYNITNDGESTHNTGTAKTKLVGVPTGDPVAQTVVQGTTTAELNPADFVTNLKGVFASETVTATGFETEKTFSTVGDDSVVVLIKGNKTDFIGKVTVPVKIIAVSNTATVQNLTNANSQPGTTTTANYKDTLKYTNTVSVAKTSSAFSVEGSYLFPLPSGITYKSGSFKLNGTAVADDQLTIEASGIKLNEPLVDDQTNTITFDAVVESKLAEKLSSTFSFVNNTGKAVTTANEVSVTTSGTPQLSTTTEIYGVNSEKKDTNGEYTQVSKFGEIQKKVFDYGDTIDISNEPIVLQGKTNMAANGWVFQNSVQQRLNNGYVDVLETKITTTETTGKVLFLYVAKKGTIKVQFVDEAGTELKEAVSFVAPIPDGAVDLTKVSAVTNALDDLVQDHYQLVTAPKDETGITPKADETITVQYVLKKKKTIVDPEDGVTPFIPENPSTSESLPQNETTADLRIQYVSTFDFGTNTRNLIQSNQFLSEGDYGSTEDGQTKKVPAFVSINDDRKTPTGWDLSVSTSDFVNKTSSTQLKGAYMTLSDFKYNGPATQKPEVVNKDVEISSTPNLVSSSSTGLYGSWSLALGEVTEDDKSSGVNLTVPKNAARSLGEYTTEIIWTLTPKI